MLPSLLSEQIRVGTDAFLKSTFSLADGVFKDMLFSWLESGHGIKGPYFSLGLPFRPGESNTWFTELGPEFSPYMHQERAYERLAPHDGMGMPRSTIVATGTGSGKTECFLYPVYAHCLKEHHLGHKGIKAILIYPMNALATDQASRIAAFIAGRRQMEGIRAGLYIGGLQDTVSSSMSARSVITDRSVMREDPPDILITNYKMLDLLMQRKDDKRLWRYNTPETLRFLVVDELHTFDGAQGTDLACLIRRLKDRLRVTGGSLCCVGTSATLGSGSEAERELLQYVQNLFGEPFDKDSIIRENRLSAAEFLGTEPDFVYSDTPRDLNELLPDPRESLEDYLCRQYRAWFCEEAEREDFKDQHFLIELGRKLRSHIQFRNAVRRMGSDIVSSKNLTERLFRHDDALSRARLNSLLSLVSVARTESPGHLMPMLQLRVHLWIRELTNVLASVEKKPELSFLDDSEESHGILKLPVVYCRECGRAGWIGLTNINGTKVYGDVRAVYHRFFEGGRDYHLFFPDMEKEEGEDGHDGHDGQDGKDGKDGGKFAYLCGRCANIFPFLSDGKCPGCGGEDVVEVLHGEPGETGECPSCGAVSPWIILGSRSASLTSAIISMLTVSRLNSDKKIITFSDNVQDAAHRAGFYGARTYAPTIRAATVQCLQALERKPRLSEFATLFETYWKKRTQNSEEYIALFLPPSLEWLSEFEEMKSSSSKSSHALQNLMKILSKRLEWDFYAAFTYLSTMGRTLEKIGLALAFIPKETLLKTAGDLHELAINQIESLKGYGEESFLLFLAGFLRHMRCLGSVFYNDKLRKYAHEKGNFYSINKEEWMPKLSRRSKAPVFLSSQKAWNNSFDPIWARKGNTWCIKWAQKIFKESSCMIEENFILNLYDLTMNALKKNGLVEEMGKEKYTVWGLTRDSLRLSSRVVKLRCSMCGREIAADEEEAEIWENAPCVRKTCAGKYTREENSSDFYAGLYSSGDVYRLFTAEHTGLLERDEREETEMSFKRESIAGERKPWDLNLLSCTPTLEMGIDIGTLSTTIQCSVPPAQANYLQRTGRAGRRNGNALSVTIAAGHPHDLYFYAQPERMMCGDVTPPAIFLNAAAVLERQLTAFCIDRWIVQEESSGIPDSMEDVLKIQAKIKKGKIPDTELLTFFPYNLLDFIQKNAAFLCKDFLSLFPEVEKETADYLKIFIMGGENLRETPLFSKIVDVIAREEREISSYEKRRTKLKNIRSGLNKKISQGVVDEGTEADMLELRREISALGELYKNALSRSTFEFLTDESLLPNYAFPEQGVTLHSVVYKKEKNSLEDGDSRTFSYHRSAASALSELAPGSTFYAGKRRVTITKIDVMASALKDEPKAGSMPGQDSVERWRMCPSCSYMERESVADVHGNCPLCGDALFADSGQVYNLLRVSQVFSNTIDRESRVDDSLESRSLFPYVRHMLINYDRADCRRTFTLDTEKTVFAFTYISKASFREINFGTPASKENVRIGGNSVPREGFRICRYCGCVLFDDDPNTTPQKTQHEWGCKAKKKSDEDTGMECLYLYRHFESEAVKILLPFCDGDRTDKLESFIAAFNMGMKLKFGGALGHLQTTLHTEPDPTGSELKRQFLVVYDSVPGGTGYLKELMEGSSLIDILQIALDHLQRCDCEDVPGHDGCYACLRAYSNSSRSSFISKHVAVDILRPIVSNKASLKEIDSLDTVSVTSNFESALEERFIEALRRSGKKNSPLSLKTELIHGKTGFFLSLGSVYWLIEQQVELGPEQGISVPSRADFLFTPARSKEGGRPIVIFTDGWMWHKNRIGKDMEQRMALIRSGRYLVWSLTWEDVESCLHPSEDARGSMEFVEPSWNTKTNELWEKLCQMPLFSSKGRAVRVKGKNSWDIFLEYLNDPSEEKYRLLATQYVFLYAGLHKCDRESYVASLCAHNAEFERWALREDMKMQGLCLHGSLSSYFGVYGEKTVLSGLAFLYFVDDEALDTQEFKNTWRGFLRAVNLFQFLPAFAAFTSSASIASIMTIFEESGREAVTSLQEEQEWQDAARLLFLPDEQRLFSRIRELGASLPEIGYPLTDENKGVQGELEMAWPAKKIGIVAPGDSASLNVGCAQGWTIMPYEEALQNPERLSELLGA